MTDADESSQACLEDLIRMRDEAQKRGEWTWDAALKWQAAAVAAAERKVADERRRQSEAAMKVVALYANSGDTDRVRYDLVLDCINATYAAAERMRAKGEVMPPHPHGLIPYDATHKQAREILREYRWQWSGQEITDTQEAAKKTVDAAQRFGIVEWVPSKILQWAEEGFL